MTTHRSPSRRAPWAFVFALLLFACWAGCMAMGGESYDTSSGDYGVSRKVAAPQSSTGLSDDWGGEGGLDRFASLEEAREYDGIADAESAARGSAVDKSETTSNSIVEGRKLIRTGDISVNVEEYQPFRQALDERLKELGGFVSDASLDHYSGRVSWATLTVRVSSQHFDELVGWAESEVEVSSLNITTQDVTEEWVDVKSRIDNWKATETRLLEILDDRTADLGDVLAVERELARVREEIERAEGRLRVLADQVELATLTIHVSVRNPYDPPVDPPGFGSQIADIFMASLEMMLNVAKGITLLTVGASPWLLILLVAAYLFYRFVRMLVRRKSA